jgi:hypothetical protein
MLVIYLFGAAGAGIYYLASFLMDGTTSNTDLASWMVVLVAAIAWPIVFPLSCAEIYRKSHPVDEDSDTVFYHSA